MTEDSRSRPLIEIGILIVGRLDQIDEAATKRAGKIVDEFLEERFPEFEFKLYAILRPEMATEGVAQPSVLLQQAVEERDLRHWDFAFVLTAAELKSYYSPRCYAALSRPFDAAILSILLIDPVAVGEDADQGRRIERIAHRLSRLMIHAVGHLTGLHASEESDNLMAHPSTVGSIDSMNRLNADQIERQRASFAEIADQRLEERSEPVVSKPVFAAQATWINRWEILQAIGAARPWQFPRRLSSLSLASISTLAVLFMTAEAWDLALDQAWWRIAVLVIGTWCVTTGYVAVRQQLFVMRSRNQSEQAVMTAVSALAIVSLGMLVTWVLLVFFGMVISGLLFRENLIESWAAASSLELPALALASRLKMAMFSGSLGLLIGGLGASFESQHYFRHVIFVDEEI